VALLKTLVLKGPGWIMVIYVRVFRTDLRCGECSG
jgi:hypothetical protein